MATQTYEDCGAVQRPASPPGGSTTALDSGAVERNDAAAPPAGGIAWLVNRTHTTTILAGAL